MSTRAHRGTSRAFRKPIRTPECRPDRQKVGKHTLALPRTCREPQSTRGPGRVDTIAARSDAATNALGSPAAEGWHRHSKAPPAPQASPGFPRINS